MKTFHYIASTLAMLVAIFAQTVGRWDMAACLLGWAIINQIAARDE